MKLKRSVFLIMKSKLGRIIGIDGSVGIFTFLLYRLLFVTLLFHNRNVSPEPDDVYSYLAGAKHLFQITTFEQYRSLFFSIWLNLISFITHSNLENSFRLNFYIGTFLLFFTVIFFVRKIEKNLINRLILISVLGLYSGSGNYHGFYWVVPTFYQFIIFLLILSAMLYKKTKAAILFLLTGLFIFIHASSILFLLIFPINLVLQSIKSKKRSTNIIKPLIVIGSGLFFYLFYSLFSSKFANPNNFISPKDTLFQVSQNITGHVSLISWPIIKQEYFSIIFSNPFFTLGYLLSIYFVVSMKKYYFLSLYFSVFILVLFSSMIPFGYRTLGFLWPLTFILVGYLLIGIYETIKRFHSLTAAITILCGLLLFGFLATNYNLVWIKSINLQNNYSWDRSCAPRAIEEKYTPIIFSNWDGYFAFQVYGLPLNEAQILSKDSIIKPNQIIVTTTPYSQQEPQLSVIQKLLTATVTRKNKPVNYVLPNYYWTELGATNFNMLTDLKTQQLFDCGHFIVSKVLEH